MNIHFARSNWVRMSYFNSLVNITMSFFKSIINSILKCLIILNYVFIIKSNINSILKCSNYFESLRCNLFNLNSYNFKSKGPTFFKLCIYITNKILYFIILMLL